MLATASSLDAGLAFITELSGVGTATAPDAAANTSDVEAAAAAAPHSAGGTELKSLYHQHSHIHEDCNSTESSALDLRAEAPAKHGRAEFLSHKCSLNFRP